MTGPAVLTGLAAFWTMQSQFRGLGSAARNDTAGPAPPGQIPTLQGGPHVRCTCRDDAAPRAGHAELLWPGKPS